MTDLLPQDKLKKATGVICKQGMFPFPLSETAITIISRVVKEEQELDLICAFNEDSSQTMEQLKQTSGFSEEHIERLTNSLAKAGLLFNQPSSRGVMIYRLLPLVMIGLMEYKFMTQLTGSDEERELAELFETLLAELRDEIQNNYDALKPLFEGAPAVDRTVPSGQTDDGKTIRKITVDQQVDMPDDFVVPSQTIEDIINKFDEIAVGYCFCRQRRSLLGDDCATSAPMLNCFTFGKSARHTVAQGFAKKISRAEALRIMKEAEEAGLVHKAFHPGARETSPETSICNCCKDCCDTFGLWRNGTMPLINSTYHLAMIDPDLCTGCGTCVDWCPTDAIALDDEGFAERDENACIGCGVCARFCPDSAISLKEGLRRVYVQPPRLREKR